jgi:hypothetical protein
MLTLLCCPVNRSQAWRITARRFRPARSPICAPYYLFAALWVNSNLTRTTLVPGSLNRFFSLRVGNVPERRIESIKCFVAFNRCHRSISIVSRQKLKCCQHPFGAAMQIGIELVLLL